VPSHDAGAMAAALLQMQQDPQAARVMGQLGRDAAVSRFSMQAMAASYQRVYDELLTPSR
jgi:glycosyltransferase involved in cell wall biosynthesis